MLRPQVPVCFGFTIVRSGRTGVATVAPLVVVQCELCLAGSERPDINYNISYILITSRVVLNANSTPVLTVLGIEVGTDCQTSSDHRSNLMNVFIFLTMSDLFFYSNFPLQKWLEVSGIKSRQVPTCELCNYQFHRRKKFRVSRQKLFRLVLWFY